MVSTSLALVVPSDGILHSTGIELAPVDTAAAIHELMADEPRVGQPALATLPSFAARSVFGIAASGPVLGFERLLLHGSNPAQAVPHDEDG